MVERNMIDKLKTTLKNREDTINFAIKLQEIIKNDIQSKDIPLVVMDNKPEPNNFGSIEFSIFFQTYKDDYGVSIIVGQVAEGKYQIDIKSKKGNERDVTYFIDSDNNIFSKKDTSSIGSFNNQSGIELIINAIALVSWITAN